MQDFFLNILAFELKFKNVILCISLLLEPYVFMLSLSIIIYHQSSAYLYVTYIMTFSKKIQFF